MVDSGERMLLAGDFHLGIEYELAKMGISIPYQTERFLGELVALVKEHRPDRIILLGDIKHGVPVTSFQEKREIPRFFNALMDLVDRVEVTRGNHDGNIQNLVPEGVKIHTSRGVLTGGNFKVAALHGHAWPRLEMLQADLMVLAHSHPTVRLNTPLGVHITKRCWMQGATDPELLASAYLAQDSTVVSEDPVNAFKEKYGVTLGAPRLVIAPTFNDLMGGLPVNSETPKTLLGPLFRSGAVDPEKFDVNLLDGSYLGKVDFLRTLA
jgi:metallophosphoesterase superfamily enzyme